MNKYINKLAGAWLSLILIFMYSCQGPDNAGLEILPSGDQLNVRVTDTITLESLTVREDSVSASGTSANLAGAYIDPVFGLCRAGFFAQLAPLKNAPNFGVEPVADSVVLALSYSGSYGDTTATALPQTFHVYQVTQDLYKDTTYYSNAKIAWGTRIGSYTFVPNTKDSVLVAGVLEAPQLRLRLDTSFFRTYILNQSGQTTLSSVSAFQSYFKGIYVTPAKQSHPGNRILYFNLASVITRMHVYYHNATDTGVYDLQIDAQNSCATINHFEHSYVGTPVQQQLTDSTLGSKQIFVQGMSGLKAKLRMPYLKNLSSIGKIAINKAELVLTLENNAGLGYSPIEQVAIQGIDSLGNGVFTGDYFESISYRGGGLNNTSGEYRTNITRYVQQVLTGKTKDNGLYLVVYGGAVFANRSIIQGAGPLTPKRIKLEVTYSLLN